MKNSCIIESFASSSASLRISMISEAEGFFFPLLTLVGSSSSLLTSSILEVLARTLVCCRRGGVTNQGIGPRRTDTEALVTRETSAGRVPLVPCRCRAGRTAENSRGHSLDQSPGVWERIQPSMGKLYHNGMIR